MYLQILMPLLALPIIMKSDWFKKVSSFKGAFKMKESFEASSLIECATSCSLLKPDCEGFLYDANECSVGEVDKTSCDVTPQICKKVCFTVF